MPRSLKSELEPKSDLESVAETVFESESLEMELESELLESELESESLKLELDSESFKSESE